MNCWLLFKEFMVIPEQGLIALGQHLQCFINCYKILYLNTFFINSMVLSLSFIESKIYKDKYKVCGSHERLKSKILCIVWAISHKF